MHSIVRPVGGDTRYYAVTRRNFAMPIYIHRNRWRNSRRHFLSSASTHDSQRRKLTASCDEDVTLAKRWCNVHGLVRVGRAFHGAAFEFATESWAAGFSLKILFVNESASAEINLFELTHRLDGSLSLRLALPRLNSFLLHRQRPRDIVKLVVESTCIAHGLALTVTAPQRCRRRVTIVTA